MRHHRLGFDERKSPSNEIFDGDEMPDHQIALNSQSACILQAGLRLAPPQTGEYRAYFILQMFALVED